MSLKIESTAASSLLVACGVLCLTLGGWGSESDLNTAAVRAESNARLKRLGNAVASKALRDLLEERIVWLDAWEQAVKARRDAEHPEPSPERQAAEWKSDRDRMSLLLARAAKDSEALLPTSFRGPAAPLSDATRAEMKEAIDAAGNDLREWSEKLETFRADLGRRTSGALASLRIERDKVQQRTATGIARRSDLQAALTAAKAPADREIARERLVNFEWEERVEAERLKALEARIALEERRSDLSVLRLEVIEAHVHLARTTLERIQARYRAVVDRQENRLKQAAASEQRRAERTDDPLQRYRARRQAELLDMQAKVLKDETALTTTSARFLEEQRSLAEHAEADFAGVKRLLDDGRVSHLDALRLNNDFRRIGPERDRIVANELAVATNQVTAYENALSGVEIELINDSRDDRFERETLLEVLPKARGAEALTIFEEVETKHRSLLNRHRVVLEKLAERAEQTDTTIQRRLRTLDAHYGFIRTHIFWVRDQEPIGAATLTRGRREVLLLGKSLIRLALECGDRSLWGRVSAEFALAALAGLALPWPLLRIPRWLNRSGRPLMDSDPDAPSTPAGPGATGGEDHSCEPCEVS